MKTKLFSWMTIMLMAFVCVGVTGCSKGGDDADDQEQLKFCTYQNLCKLIPHFPFKAALKRYIIKNTRKIYSVPFTGVYKIIGDYCDENFYQNGTIKDVQNEFIKKLRTYKG